MNTLSTKNQIRKILQEALSTLNVEQEHIVVEYPEQEEHGHYSSPVAMGLAKALKKNPRQIAEELLQIVQQNTMFSRVEIAGPGFLNFFLSDEFLTQKLTQILDESTFGSNTSLADQHILLEYISANPTGPLHIGHGRWAAVGDSLSRLLKFSGATVFREFYVNDAGVQIAHLRTSVEAVQQGKPVPEDGYRGSYIKELAEEVSKTSEMPEILMQESQRQTLIKFRTEFDNWFSEKSLHKDGIMEEVFSELRQKDAIYEEDGATWFRSTSYSNDDKDRVIVKGDGAYTYFASDIAYHRDKIKRGFPILINILGFDHHGYVERMKAATRVFGGELSILLGQMVNLFRNGDPVRMSKRTGDMISLDDVIDEIGTDATRYLLLRRPMNSSVDFDLETAKTSSDDNPVFYVQYAHARIASILRNAQKKIEFSSFTHEQERRLLREMIKFEDAILEISKTYDLHKLPSYLEDLASVYHRFYRECRIIGETEEASRLALCNGTKKILAQGLELLGVVAPEKMDSKDAS